MAFTSAIVTTKHLSPGNLQRVEGTWDADSVTKGTIDLTDSISEVYMCGVSLHTGTGLVGWDWNRTDASKSTVANGKIAIHECTADDEGRFWAVGPIA